MLSGLFSLSHRGTTILSGTQQYDDDFDDYDDDEFEDEEPTPQKQPPPGPAPAANQEDDIARMIREENEKAMKESKFVTNVSSPTSGGKRNKDENNEPAPIKAGLDREHLVNAYGNAARSIKLPERKVKGLPVKGSGAVTDAQIEAARARVTRWKLVNAAVGGMNYQDAACGTDNLLNNEPCTSRELFERGVGPYANCQMATTVRRPACAVTVAVAVAVAVSRSLVCSVFFFLFSICEPRYAFFVFPTKTPVC